MTTDVELRIDKARWFVMQNQPFYGALSMRLKDEISDKVATAATNGTKIMWNPDFVSKLSEPELRFVLIHETMHCAHQHMWRLPKDTIGNMAGDYVINELLSKIQGVALPQGALLDPKYFDMSEEEVYNELIKNAPPPDPDGVAACGEFTGPPEEDDGGGNEGEKGDKEGKGSGGVIQSNLQEKWEQAVVQAAQVQQASGQGDLPGTAQRMLDKVRAVHVDWKAETADFVKRAVNERNDWSRPARRHATARVIIPRRQKDGLGKIVFARDTSGSVCNETLALYSALIEACMADTMCSAIILDCDTRIQKTYDLQPGEVCPLEAEGGGGTDFRPVFSHVDEIIAGGEEVAGVVYLTDMYGPFPDDSEVPTMWLSTSEVSTAPFGHVIKVEL